MIATIEFAEACQAALDNGRKQYEIAEAAGCARRTVGYALEALAEAKIVAGHTVPLGDLEPSDFDAAMKKVRAPKAPKDESPLPLPPPRPGPQPPPGGGASHPCHIPMLQSFYSKQIDSD